MTTRMMISDEVRHATSRLLEALDSERYHKSPMTADAHHCRCDAVARCTILAHPSTTVQAALNQLVDAMAAFDEETGACSVLVLHSTHAAGVFTSVTRQGEERGHG